MTLNITVAARWLMAQSSDFRLTSEENGKTVIKSESAQKQFILHYPQWSGLLCYTGIAHYRARGLSHDTAAWLQKLLEHPPDEQRSPRDIPDLLITEGAWLRKIPPTDRRTTFTMIAYDEKNIPRVWVISNYERPDLPPQPVGADDLYCTCLRARGPRCVVTGWAPAVSAEQRHLLLDLLATVPPRDNLSDAIAITNREASANAQDTVSKECIVATLSPDGSGQVTVYGDLPKEFLPSVILRGMTLPVADVLKQQGLTDQMLDAVSWPPRSQTLNGNTAVAQSFRSISGYKWPDDPTAPPRQSAPVEVTFKPNQ